MDSSDNLPLSEIFRKYADDWVDKDAAARILEETRTLRLAQKCKALGNIAVNKAEQTVKASLAWQREIEDEVNARTEANRAKVRLEYIRMKHTEWVNSEANNRAEAKL